MIVDSFNYSFKISEQKLNAISSTLDEISENLNTIGLSILDNCNNNNQNFYNLINSYLSSIISLLQYSSQEETLLISANMLDGAINSMKADITEIITTLNSNMNAKFEKAITDLTPNDTSEDLVSILDEISKGFINVNQNPQNLVEKSSLGANPFQMDTKDPEVSDENGISNSKKEESIDINGIISELSKGIGSDLLSGEIAEALTAVEVGSGGVATPEVILAGGLLMAIGYISDYFNNTESQNKESQNTDPSKCFSYRDPSVSTWDKITAAFSNDACMYGYDYSGDGLLSAQANLSQLLSGWLYDTTGIPGWWYNEEVSGKNETTPEEYKGSFQEYSDALNQYAQDQTCQAIDRAIESINWEEVLSETSADTTSNGTVDQYNYSNLPFSKQLKESNPLLYDILEGPNSLYSILKPTDKSNSNEVSMNNNDISQMRASSESDSSKIIYYTSEPTYTIKFGDVHETADISKIVPYIRNVMRQEIVLGQEGVYNG